ncbi:MAG: hypothetical protein JWM73_2967, partial [Solirubrobacterales bacterium]|nr:hypothetical protein [Solirubrobacterales bacterium]
LTKSEWTSFGVTYVPKLWVAGTSCANGKTVVRAFHKCRKAHGGITGRCPVKVLGYRCKETRTTGPQQISSKVVCSNGSRRVGHYYNQNT